MDTSIVEAGFPATQAGAKKPPRKPRPSEIAAKKAKAAKVRKPAKTKRKVAKIKKPAKKTATAKKPRGSKPKAKAGVVDRSERIDCRVSKTEKIRIVAKAKRLRRTVTSLLVEAVEKIK